MSAQNDTEPQTRRERLAAIAEEYTEEIHDRRSREQVSGIQPVSRFAAVTSEGSADSSYSSNGNLLVAESTAELAELLRQECGEGWFAHGRVWDLDAPFDNWRNLEIAYSVRVGEECTRPVQVVRVEGREDGMYLFEDPARRRGLPRGGEPPRRRGRAERGAAPRPPRGRAADGQRARAMSPRLAGDPSRSWHGSAVRPDGDRPPWERARTTRSRR